MLMIKKKIGTVFELLLEECNIFLNKIGIAIIYILKEACSCETARLVVL